MSDKLSLIIVIHNHQPVGNFPSVLNEATQKSYLPFIKILSRFPQLKINLHYSGFLMKWLLKNHSGVISLLKRMLKKGQIDILGGGIYEPILPSIPTRDAREQLKLLNLLIEENFGICPQGFWLAERVWEPQIPEIVTGLGLKFTFLDDNHFACAGFDRDNLDGYYVTESGGKELFIFPINEDLRYLVPFKKVSKVIDYLRRKREEGVRCVTLGADGEKFGVWPGTHNWVYGKRWLEVFFKALRDNEDWIETRKAPSFIKENSAKGLAYLPTASYDKMMFWALPIQAQANFRNSLKTTKKKNKHRSFTPFLRGGFWKNFFVKYPEANSMHKRMLLVSNKGNISRHKKSFSYKRGIDFLYRSQCNDAYWHGLFGGLYLPHLREAIYENLIKAENLLEKNYRNNSFECKEFDFNLDGRKEILLSSKALSLFFEPAYGGSLFELDLKKKNINLINTLSRKKEFYHQKRRYRGSKPKRIVFDWYLRRAFQEHFLSSSTSLKEFKNVSFRECGDFINRPYFLIEKNNQKVVFERRGNVWFKKRASLFHIKKEISFLKDNEIKAIYSIFNESQQDSKFIFGVEFNFSMLSAYDSQRYFECKGRKRYLDKLHNLENIKRICLIDQSRKFKIEFILAKKASLWYFPVFSVSQSEVSLEKIFQASCFFIHWPLNLVPREKWQTEFKMVFR
jgi:alpha-amylase